MTRHDHQFNDPKLQGVLDEIELRARVELAKLETMDKRVAQKRTMALFSQCHYRGRRGCTS